MTRRLFTGLAAALLPLLAQTPTPAASAGTACSSLAALTIPNVTIRSAEAVAAGPFTPRGVPEPATGQLPRPSATITLPAFCRVEATARPTTDSEIKFEVWIPPADAWNGKFEGVGNGGYSGAIVYPAMALGLRRGYAVASTDTGHSGDDMKFGQGHPEKIIDWAYRSIHLMTETSKLIVRNAQGRFAEHAYFVGCSSGGHQALSEAQRYPDDYDGIVAGDPASNRIRQTFAFMYSWIATHTPDGKPILPQSKLALLTRATVEACDALDGLKDGLIDDPRRCHYDPAKLLCKSGATDDAACLTAAQVEAAKKVYDGVRSPRTGEQIFTGWPKGSEGFGDAAGESWRAYILDPQEPMRVGFFKYFLFHDPNWDPRTIDYDRDLAYAEQKMPFMVAMDKDLTPFKKHGGKLLMYTGWSDPVVPPQDTVVVLRSRHEDDGRARQDARVLPLLHGARHGTLLRRSGAQSIRSPDRARAVGRKRDGAGQADRLAQHQRQGRSDAAALPVSAGRALERHRQHRRCGEFLVRRRDTGCARARKTSTQ